MNPTKKYVNEEDILTEWLTDCCNINPDEKGEVVELYYHFSEWFKLTISKRLNFLHRHFAIMMTRRFGKIKTESKIYYTGVDLNPLAWSIFK